MDVGERIRELRTSLNISQNALAEMSDVSQSHLRRVELGQARITVDYLQSICDALNISLADFFSTQNGEDKLSIAMAKLTPKQKAKLIDFISSL